MTDELGRAEGDIHISANAGSAGHLVQLWLNWTRDGEDVMQARSESFLSPNDAFSLAQNLISAAQSALETIARDYAAGECETCENSRMVDTRRSGAPHPRLEHCPDCKDRLERRVPVMSGAWADRDKQILR